MAKFLYLYSGGQVAETPEAQEESMQLWTSWFGSLGDSVVDMGNAFSASSTVTAGGASDGGTSKLGGYSIVSAESLTEAETRLMDVRSCSPAAALRCMRLCLCDLAYVTCSRRDPNACEHPTLHGMLTLCMVCMPCTA
jgi:hypothetical protein